MASSPLYSGCFGILYAIMEETLVSEFRNETVSQNDTTNGVRI
jgi:hypothetical protein